MLRLGDVLFRFLPEYQVWHAGIVVIIDGYTADKIEILEFDDSNKVSLVPLANYVWYRKYFWVVSFKTEKDIYGPKVFRTRRERLETAINLYKQNELSYTLHKYNCESVVRRCVFNDPKLWPSSQSKSLARSRIFLYGKIITMALFSIVYKFDKNVEFEKDMRFNDTRYYIDEQRNIVRG